MSRLFMPKLYKVMRHTYILGKPQFKTRKLQGKQIVGPVYNGYL